MAIKSNEKITTTDINALKNKINAIYANRPATITDVDRNGHTITKTFSNESFGTVTANSTIGSNLYNMIDGLLIINSIPNLLYVEQYDKILGDGLTTDLLTILDNFKWQAVGRTTTKANSGCRGACVGLCSGGCSNTSYSNG